jgi:hypothetical protein
MIAGALIFFIQIIFIFFITKNLIWRKSLEMSIENIKEMFLDGYLD